MWAHHHLSWIIAWSQMTSNGIRWLFWGKSPISDIPMLQKIAECLFIQQEGVYIWVEKRQVWSRWFVSEYEMGEHVLKNGVFRYTSNYGNFKEEKKWSSQVILCSQDTSPEDRLDCVDHLTGYTQEIEAKLGVLSWILKSMYCTPNPMIYHYFRHW